MNYNKITLQKINMMLIMKKENTKNLNLKKLKYLQYIITIKMINFLKCLLFKMILIIIIIYYKINYRINLQK